MTKTLILLRHAKAEAYADSDSARSLALRGRRQAAAVGEALEADGITLEAALVSAAQRTRQTWELLASRLSGAPDPEVREDLYDAMPRTALAIVRETSAQVSTLIVVGHEPVMSSLAALLANAESEPALVDQVRLGIPTAARCVLTFDGEWSDLERGGARLNAVTRAKEAE